MVSASTARFYNARPNGLQRFGAPRDGGARKHRGTDFSHSTSPGTAVPALLGGRVTGKLKPGPGHGFGFQITTRVVLDGRTWDVSYAHGSRTSPFTVGDSVKQGDLLSTEGLTGATQGPCMHLEVFDVSAGRFVDPMILVKKVLGGGGGGSAASLGLAAALPKPAQALAWRWTGVQRMLRARHGFTGTIGAKPGTASVAAFQRFMNTEGYARRAPRLTRNLIVDGAWGANEVRAMQQWLTERWQYSGGVDGAPGPGTKAAFGRAEKGNAAAFAAFS